MQTRKLVGEVVSEESNTKGFTAEVVLGVLRKGASLYIK